MATDSKIAGGLCPICKIEMARATYRPFCSKRCADIDLKHWLGGDYAIPAVEPPDDFEMSDPDSDPAPESAPESDADGDDLQ